MSNTTTTPLTADDIVETDKYNKTAIAIVFAFVFSVIAVLLTGGSWAVRQLNELDKEEIAKVQADNAKAFKNPIIVGELPDGRIVYQIIRRTEGSSDTIYYTMNPDGNFDITTNYGDKPRRNSPTFSIGETQPTK